MGCRAGNWRWWWGIGRLCTKLCLSAGRWGCLAILCTIPRRCLRGGGLEARGRRKGEPETITRHDGNVAVGLGCRTISRVRGRGMLRVEPMRGNWYSSEQRLGSYNMLVV